MQMAITGLLQQQEKFTSQLEETSHSFLIFAQQISQQVVMEVSLSSPAHRTTKDLRFTNTTLYLGDGMIC